MLDAYIAWFKAHERLAFIIAGGVVLWFAIGKVDTLIANHDAANFKQAEIAAAVQADKTAKDTLVAQQAAAQYQALADKVNAQNELLVQANATLAAALSARQKVDATLDPTGLAQRINTLVPDAGASVSNGQVNLKDGVAVVQQLEEVPTLTQQLADETEVANNKTDLLASADKEIDSLKAENLDLQTQIKDNQEVAKTQLASVKAEARKSKRKWFIIGFVAGFLSRQAIKSYTGI